MEDIFETRQRPSVDVPEQWLENVKTYSYTPTRYTGYPGVATVNGVPYQGRRSGSGAHLDRIGLGSHFGGWHGFEDDDVVPGPQDGGTKSKKATTPEVKSSASRSGLELPSNFWGLTGQEDLLNNQSLADEVEERIGRQSTTDLIDNEDDPVGDNRTEISDDTMLHTLEVLDSARDNARFDEIACLHGVPAAISFCSISEMSADLDQTPLLEEAALEMVGIMSVDQRMRFMKDIYLGLPECHKVQIQTNGLH